MDDADDEPVFSVQLYAEMCAEFFGTRDPDRIAIAARHGVDQKTWERGLEEWSERLDDDEDAPVAKEFRRLVMTALDRAVGPHVPVTFDAHIEIDARVGAGHPTEQVLAEHHLDIRTYWLEEFEWMVRADQDPRLKVYMELRKQKRCAELTHQVARSPFVVLGPGNLVRARRCPQCGALKASKPLTAYVYCDYCATCIDYDLSIEFRDDTALDSNRVDRALGSAIKDDLVTAFRAGDRDAYARAYAWQIEASIELCPMAYSPRIKDPVYRRRLIDDVLVPWVIITVFEQDGGDEKAAAARETALRSRTLDDILAAYAAARAVFEHEADLFEQHGLFARHPDGLGRAMYLTINSSVFVRPWLAVLSDADQQRLLTAAGVACEYVPAPEIAFSPCGCGVCGRELRIAAGATRIVCEACGHILEVGERQFPCRECGAPISLPAGSHDVVCGACNARWVR